jgi:hypothetical protein
MRANHRLGSIALFENNIYMPEFAPGYDTFRAAKNAAMGNDVRLTSMLESEVIKPPETEN